MTYEEAETLLGQAVALNIIAETCAMNECGGCPFYAGLSCALTFSPPRMREYVSQMEKKALSILNKGENSNDKRRKN